MNRGEQYRDEVELASWKAKRERRKQMLTNSEPLTFDEVLDRMAEMQARKSQDYGTQADPYANVRASQEFGIDGWKGAVLRANDKMSRLKTFIRSGRLRNESVEDSLMDLAVYAVIALVLRSQENATEAQSGK